MRTLTELQEARAAKFLEAKKIHDAAETAERDMTEDEGKEFTALTDEVETLDNRCARWHRIEKCSAPGKRQTSPPQIQNDDNGRPRVFAIPRRHSGLKNFNRERFGDDYDRRAYRAGMFYLACAGNPGAQKWCRENGYRFVEDDSTDKVHFLHQENIDTTGGYLVPDEIDRDLIDLRELYGVFRKYARVKPMESDHSFRMRRTGGLTAYLVGEGSAGTESTKSWDRVTLTPKKWMVLSTITSELGEDAVVSIGDDLSGEMAYAFANKEDECGFNGDGTSTYGGIYGVRTAFTNLSATIANIAGLFVGTGTTYASLTLADFNNVVALLPQYADTPNAKWFVHKVLWSSVMERLLTAVGGVTQAEVQGRRTHEFLGYEVVISQVMPKVAAASQVCAILGDLSLAADFGDRRGTTIAFSEHATVGSLNTFAADCLAVRATERFDINVHDVGNAHATAASRVQGPVVGLILAAS